MYDESPAERKTCRKVKPVNGISDTGNLSSCQEKELYTVTRRNKEATDVCVTYYIFTIKKRHLIRPKLWHKKTHRLIVMR